jgi:hypothetical protein
MNLYMPQNIQSINTIQLFTKKKHSNLPKNGYPEEMRTSNQGTKKLHPLVFSDPISPNTATNSPSLASPDHRRKPDLGSLLVSPSSKTPCAGVSSPFASFCMFRHRHSLLVSLSSKTRRPFDYTLRSRVFYLGTNWGFRVLIFDLGFF